MTTMNRLYCKYGKCYYVAKAYCFKSVCNFVYPFADKYERENSVLDISCS